MEESVTTVVVPGYTPLHARRPVRLTRQAERRLRRALALAERRPVERIVVSGAAVYPEGTPFVEADEMATWLEAAGWPADRIVREPHARHTHTNLRNAGRLMLERGWAGAFVVTGVLQSFYIASPARSGLLRRSVAELGYYPGDVQRISPRVTLFRPVQDVFRQGPDPRDP